MPAEYKVEIRKRANDYYWEVYQLVEYGDAKSKDEAERHVEAICNGAEVTHGR